MFVTSNFSPGKNPFQRQLFDMTALSSKPPVMFTLSTSPGTGSLTDTTTPTTVTPAAAAAAVQEALRLVNIPRFMDLSAPAVPASLSCLGPELLHLIFQQLCDIDPTYLLQVRLVCQRFNSIVTPVAYHTISLTHQLLSPSAETAFPHAFDHIRAFTRHVVIRGSLDPMKIRRVLERMPRLLTINWSLHHSHVDIDKMWPSALLDPAKRGAQKTRLYVSELPLCDYEAPNEDAYRRAIPSSMLVSLKLVHPSTPLVTNLKPLKNLLLQSSRLETLHYEDRGQGTQLVFQHPNERMPALIDLSLTSYDWQHDAKDVKRHWDFSRLRTLGLFSVPIFNFLSAVSFQDLRDLRELRVDDWSSHLPDRRLEATQMLSRLIGNHIYALDTLEVTCHVNSFDLAALRGHAGSLRRLKLRDHVGFRDGDRRCPTLQASDVSALAQTLPLLQSLEIDLDIANCPAQPFLDAVSRFSRLQVLALHVQTVVDPVDYNPAGVDLDSMEAMGMFLNLTRARAERDPTRPWKQITINVGGWQPVMVRRLGSSWRELNEQGITAERCFIATRSGNRYEMVDRTAPESHISLGWLV